MVFPSWIRSNLSSTATLLLRLFYCGAAVDKPQYMRISSSCTAAATVGIEAQQFESFYIVPEILPELPLFFTQRLTRDTSIIKLRS